MHAWHELQFLSKKNVFILGYAMIVCTFEMTLQLNLIFICSLIKFLVQVKFSGLYKVNLSAIFLLMGLDCERFKYTIMI